MASKEQKHAALEYAIEIAKEYGRGGYTAWPDDIIESAYRKIIELWDDVEKP